jgi:ABC-2 type transport system permease protein
MLLFKLLGQAIPEVAWLQWLSIFTPYEPQKFISLAANAPDAVWSLVIRNSQGRVIEPGPLGYNLILLAIGGISYAAAGLVFQKRDLPAPL